MQPQNIVTHIFDNGLTLVIETMPDVQSAAYGFLVPCGSVWDPPGRNGTSSLLSDLITRGAGQFDSRQLSDAMDNLGVQRNESVGTSHMTFNGATLAKNLPATLRFYGDILLRPLLPEDQFEPARTGLEQSLRAAEDEPRHKAIVELRRRCYDAPWGLPTDGSLDDLGNITAAHVQEQYERCFRPNGSIMGIAGCVDVEEMIALVDEIMGEWQPKEIPGITTSTCGPQIDYLQQDSTQTHIGIAYEAVPYRHPEYYAAWAAVGILSGGMSARLFTEVREKRGLCYSVSASLNSLPDEGRVLCYAGTTTERAQETLDVTIAELQRLGEGIEQNELDRCKARAKSSLVMQQESTSSRALSIARDWFHFSRVKTLTEVSAEIEALTVESVLEYVHTHPAKDFTILTIGPNQLEIPVEVS